MNQKLKIISGGQTGADRGGLEGAKKAGLETGGTAPLNYYTENGSDPSLKNFGLVEHTVWDYSSRTEENVKNSDGTVIFIYKKGTAGTCLTIKLANKYAKPYIINPTIKELRDFAKNKNIINVAGNRESIAPGMQNQVCYTIFKTFS